MTDSNPLLVKKLTSVEVGELLEGYAKILRVYNSEQEAAPAAITHLARLLKRHGSQPVELLSLAVKKRNGNNIPLAKRQEFKHLSLEEALVIIADEQTSREKLIQLAQSRFGISRSRLTKLRLEEAITIVRSAANHENSLNLLATNARDSGSNRKS